MHEPLRMIACKCSILFFAVIPYTVAYISLNLLRVPFTTLRTAVSGLGRALRAPSFLGAAESCGEAAQETAGCFITALWTVVRAPFYALQMWFGAALGMVHPLEGRRCLSIEADWHERTVHQSVGSPEELPSIWDILTQRDLASTFFLAPCMQSLGSLQDPHILSKTALSPAVPQSV